jgi:hypothetical protein
MRLERVLQLKGLGRAATRTLTHHLDALRQSR